MASPRRADDEHSARPPEKELSRVSAGWATEGLRIPRQPNPAGGNMNGGRALAPAMIVENRAGSTAGALLTRRAAARTERPCKQVDGGGEYQRRKERNEDDRGNKPHAILLDTRKGLLVVAVRTGLLACE